MAVPNENADDASGGELVRTSRVEEQQMWIAHARTNPPLRLLFSVYRAELRPGAQFARQARSFDALCPAPGRDAARQKRHCTGGGRSDLARSRLRQTTLE